MTDTKCCKKCFWQNKDTTGCLNTECDCHPPPNTLEWEKHGERADYFQPDAIVFPRNIVAIMLAAQKERIRAVVEGLKETGPESESSHEFIKRVNYNAGINSVLSKLDEIEV